MSRHPFALLLCLSWCAHAADPIDALHEAARNNDIETIQTLVASGVDVNALNAGGTPLLTAVNWNRYEAAKALVALKANVNFEIGQWTPLIRAVGRDTRLVRLLLESGAEVNYADAIFGDTALSMAATNRPNTFSQLSKKGGYLGPVPNTEQTVMLLIKAGANVNHRNRNGRTPLRAALASGNTVVIKLLVEAGADVNDRNPSPALRIYTSWDDPVWFDAIAGNADLRAIEILIRAGADTNYRNPRPYDATLDSKGKTVDGYTALTLSARWGYLPVVKLLFEHGADPCIARADGSLPITIAKERGHNAVAKEIQKHMKAECAP